MLTSRAIALAAVLALCAPASAEDGPRVRMIDDEVRLTYPDRAEHAAEPFIILAYANAASRKSSGGTHTVETRFGPLTFTVKVDSAGPETLILHDWPANMWPIPPEIVVEDGDEGFISFLPAMM